MEKRNYGLKEKKREKREKGDTVSISFKRALIFDVKTIVRDNLFSFFVCNPAFR